MYRSIQQTSVDCTDKEKQKQKKRLSFREPEAEIVQSLKSTGSNLYNKASQSKSYSLMPKTETRRYSASLEDLSLEDQVMQIVHNVGQAFEKQTSEKSKLNCVSSEYLDNISKKKKSTFCTEFQQKERSEGDGVAELNNSDPVKPQTLATEQKYLESLASPLARTSARNSNPIIAEACTSVIKNTTSGVVTCDQLPVNSSHQMQLMKYQIEQQSKQAQAALDHIQLLKDQLDAESAARYKAQAQCHHLLKQNKDLLDHVQSLFKQIQELENFIVKLQHKLPVSDSQLISRTTSRSNLGMNQGKVHPVIADGSVLHYNAAYFCNGGSVIKSQNPHSTADPTEKSIKHENILLKIEDSYPIASDHMESTPQEKCMETNSSHLKSKFSVQVKCTTGNVVPSNVSTPLTYNTAAARNTLPVYSSVPKITNGSTTHFSNHLSDRYNGNTFKPLVIEEIAEPGSKSTSKHEFIESSPASVSTLQLSGEQPYSKLYSGYPKPLKSYFNDYIPKPLHGPELSNEEREKALRQLQSMAQW